MSEPDIKKLGKYEIISELGKGAMGVVYKGLDPMIERHVAIKTVLSSLVEGKEGREALARFKREAQAAGRITHPNIVGVYEYGEENGVAYIAMQYVEGVELKDFFDKDERFTPDKIVDIMKQLLSALDYAHKQGVVHRDIKPANIMIVDKGEVKVTDFGVARIESSTMTQAGAVLGTPSYMSPEQFMGQTVDNRSDIFSAGAVLYQLLTGEKPFTGSLTTIMHRVLNVDPDAPSKLNVQIPAVFDSVVAKAMAKRPQDRFQSAAEFSQALDDALNGKTGIAVEDEGDATVAFGSTIDDDATVAFGAAMPTPAVPPASPTPAGANTQAPATKEQPAKSKGLVVGIAAVVVLALALGGWFITRKQGGSDTGGNKATTTDSRTSGNSVAEITPKAKTPTPVDTGAARPTEPATVSPPAEALPQGQIYIQTEPAGAVVKLQNGEFLGVTNNEFTLDVGDYDFVISKRGYQESEISTSIEDDQKSVLKIRLEKQAW